MILVTDGTKDFISRRAIVTGLGTMAHGLAVWERDWTQLQVQGEVGIHSQEQSDGLGMENS